MPSSFEDSHVERHFIRELTQAGDVALDFKKK